MTPTERQRIEKEAKEFANPWTPPNSNRRVTVDSYIAGATAEHERYSNRASALLPQLFGEQLEQERDKARNQAIQDCIEKVNDFKSISDPVITFVFTTITKALEQLKINHESSTTKRTN